MTDSAETGAREDVAERIDTLIVGTGIGGVVVAHDLAARGYHVLAIDAAEQLGGVTAKLVLDGLSLDAGAESFATRGGGVAALASEIGLEEDIVSPNPAGAWLQLDGSAVPLPKQTLLGIPSSPLARDVIAAVGWSGALRAYADRLMPVVKVGHDDALGPLVRRRMGQKVLDRLVAPLAGGVYSADVNTLDVDTVAPGLNNALTRAGSLSGAVSLVLEERAAASEERAAASEQRPGSAVQGIRGGVHRITERLIERARAHRAEFRTGTRAARAEATATGWRVHTESGERFDAASLVLDVPEAQVRQILGDAVEFDTTDAESAGVTVEIVTLVFPPGAIAGEPRGTGVLVASDSSKIRAKAMTHSSAKWPWLREAAEGREIVRLSYGAGSAAPATASMSDAEAAAQALADARVMFGQSLPEPVASARVRWQQGQPSSVVGARARQRTLRERAEALPNLVLVGAAVAGTGLAQVVPDARVAALRIRRERFAQPGTPWTAEVGDEAPADSELATRGDA